MDERTFDEGEEWWGWSTSEDEYMIGVGNGEEVREVLGFFMTRGLRTWEIVWVWESEN